ncbi:MAG: hypothetical protein O2894_03915 [Planctomycetota bacterium]|nr:hypothetical protein [Planctomycetota bacterium]
MRPIALALLLVSVGALRSSPCLAKDGEVLERYPPSFRIAVKEAIDGGVRRLRELQAVEGHFGDPAHDQAMGHTALPLLAMLKAGVPADDPQVRRAMRALGGMKVQRVYSAAVLLMALHAYYDPTLDTNDADVDTDRSKRVDPKATREKLSAEHAARVQEALDYLLRAQNASGLWHYDVPAMDSATGRDLSNVQYALLGLRAAMDCGFRVHGEVWRSALRGLLEHQDVKGDELELQRREARDGYVFTTTEKAESRPFHYSVRKKNGPLGEATVWENPATGSMTTAGIACMAICQEGLWRTRKFKGSDRKKSADSIRDGLDADAVHGDHKPRPSDRRASPLLPLRARAHGHAHRHALGGRTRLVQAGRGPTA